VYEEFVVTGAWWDLVDETAGNLLDELHQQSRTGWRADARWSTAPEMWAARSIICQLRHKQATDLRLLYDHRAEPGRPGVLHPQGDRLGCGSTRDGPTRSCRTANADRQAR
jgi:hypothetical protein